MHFIINNITSLNIEQKVRCAHEWRRLDVAGTSSKLHGHGDRTGGMPAQPLLMHAPTSRLPSPSPTLPPRQVKELKAIVATDYWPWFANYLVVKRAAQVGSPCPQLQGCLGICFPSGSTCSGCAAWGCKHSQMHSPLLCTRSTSLRPPPPPRLPPQEPNFHHTYVQLVDRWGERRMRDTLVQTTVHYIKASWGGL